MSQQNQASEENMDKKESHRPLYLDRLEVDFVLSILGIERRVSHTLVSALPQSYIPSLIIIAVIFIINYYFHFKIIGYKVAQIRLKLTL